MYHCIVMRTTVTLDDDLFEMVQAQAQASGKRFGEVLSALVRRGLKARDFIPVAEGGLPVFEVPEDAPVIPGNRAKKILDEERG